jgi:hypothetical protein
MRISPFSLIKIRTHNWQQNLQNTRRASTLIAANVQHHEYPRPYNEIPGPKPAPLIGNGWRFMPLIGK